MIYVSSCSVRADSIRESVDTLAKAGIRNIELTGGTRYYPEYEDDLLELKIKYDLNYLVHNYFPPPPEPFILNLATLDEKVHKLSVEHCLNAIKLSRRLGCEKYGVHAGFLIDFSMSEVGKKIERRRLYDRAKAMKQFINAWNILKSEASKDIRLYIENNVISSTNARTYQGENPFLLTDYSGYQELKEHLEFTLLLDLAHLKVSVNSLDLDFSNEARQMLSLTDYLHISGNDGLHDQNNGIENDVEIQGVLKQSDITGKTITLEIYEGIPSILKSMEWLDLLN